MSDQGDAGDRPGWGAPEGPQAPRGPEGTSGEQPPSGQPGEWSPPPPPPPPPGQGGWQQPPPGWQGQPAGQGGWQPPPEQGGWQQPPYGGQQPPPGYGYAPQRQTESSAIVALVLAIMAWFLCPVILAVAALLVAKSSDEKIRASNGSLEGEGMNKAARIIAWINIGVFALTAIGFVLLIVATATTSSTTTY